LGLGGGEIDYSKRIWFEVWNWSRKIGQGFDWGHWNEQFLANRRDQFEYFRKDFLRLSLFNTSGLLNIRLEHYFARGCSNPKIFSARVFSVTLGRLIHGFQLVKNPKNSGDSN